MPFYFICQNDISGRMIRIGLPLAHHLIHVLRYQSGDSVVLIDEQQKKYNARIIAAVSGCLELEIVSEEKRRVKGEPLFHLGIALIKGDRTDWVVEKATELGVCRISPLMTRRVVVKPDGHRLDHRKKRWEAIAKEAAQQSERWEIPEIDPPVSLESFLKETASADIKLIFWEKEGATGSLREQVPVLSSFGRTNRPAPTIVLLIGPEGGWEEEEVAWAKKFGYLSVSLGDRPLRADTAAVTALALLRYETQISG